LNYRNAQNRAGCGMNMADKNRRKHASKQLEKLLEEHLAKFTPTEQAKMHDQFEKRVSTRRDSDAKTPSPLRVGTR
jgi:hypothetical protein